ncbi:hypothetical protein SK803_04190 [Lentzea sp. BCCO 10_0856]|uniref:Uncharacterized protein n=1 Tax=Lentzea miocenica TaxID=3095431 RepID=A0ABU4SU93_9PSEU|nr:hypothetical protein [Lentzea sp. BCCO 10_0856]MDX8029394.1 hypothetical protein [Lentzea sp. BCCO 10_0856]
MKDTLDQLYETKAQLIAVLSTVIGIGLLMLNKWPPAVEWLLAFPLPIPLGELGAGFFGFGVLGIYFQILDRAAGDRRLDKLISKAIRHEAPAFSGAVIDSLAFKPETLETIAASDDLLDRVAANALALRLKDKELAQDLYTDVRDQVINAAERWRDVDVSVSLRPWAGGPVSGPGSMFAATVRWEYKVRSASPTLRFACVAGEREYREMLHDPANTAVWHFDLSGGLAAEDPDVFELVSLLVDGKEREIQRTSRDGAQVYTASLGEKVPPDQEVTLSYTYRALVQRHGHELYLDVPRPAKGLHVQLDYASAGIRRMNTIDYISSSQRPRVEHSRRTDDAKTVNISFDGWTLPRAGVAFVWVLNDEL